MKNVKLTRHPKDPLGSKLNQPKGRKGEGVLERLTESPKDPLELNCIQSVEEKGEALSDLISIEEPLSVEVCFGALYILVVEAPSNENGLALAIVMASPPMVQNPSV